MVHNFVSIINHLKLTNSFSVTDTVAMDCEMVGVGQGNKSALGRVTVVFISFFPFSPH